jgi:uncharacterized protein (DUF488 family)
MPPVYLFIFSKDDNSCRIAAIMKNSERTILALLMNESCVMTRLRLVKLLFLLNRAGVENAYDFIPYKYGPFSFQLYRDLNKLSQDGWIDGEHLQLCPGKKNEAVIEIRKLPTDVRDKLLDIRSSYGRLSEDALLKTVYTKHPEFTFKSELIKSVAHAPKAPISIYTIGYEGASIDAFLNTLLQKGIARLIDVRSNPVSRKWGFAKSTLAGLCEKIGIEYVHIPELGISSDKREGLATKDDYKTLLDAYEKQYLPTHKGKIQDALSLVGQGPSVLVCMEADVQMCHRGRLANKLAKMIQLPIVHLTVK